MDRMQLREMPFKESMRHVENANDLVDLAMVIIAGIFVVGVLFLVYKLITKPINTVDPMQIAQERYAKGEISAEDYSAIKKELK
jgi:uncharacterized membrane protein